MSTPVITIYVRHGQDKKTGKPCKYADDEMSRRCNCPKHFRWTQNGKQYRRKAGTRSWEIAEEIKRQLQDQLTGRTPETRPEDNTRLIAEAIKLFTTDKKVQGVGSGQVSRYVCELGRLQSYCESQNVFTVPGITRELLTGYAETWEDHYAASSTRAGVRERLRTFLRYCYDAKWLDRVPGITKIEVDESPTMPLVGNEYERLLKALPTLHPLRGTGEPSPNVITPKMLIVVRGVIQLMRWSGLAITDAVALPKASFTKAGGLWRVVTHREKTGTDVSVVIPEEAAKDVMAAWELSPNKKYIFWSGEGTAVAAGNRMGKRFITPAFESAGLTDGTHMKSHRLRDTFAVHLLQKGVPLPDVSKALGHKSIKTTEKHYAKWVQGRQDRLDALVMGTWQSAGAKRRKKSVAA